jgi:hypothetical protein
MAMNNVGQQGWGQGTAAMQALMRRGLSIGGARPSGAGKRKRRKRGSAVASAVKRVGRKVAKRARRAALVKGSAAAKAWGRKMRAKRKSK